MIRKLFMHDVREEGEADYAWAKRGAHKADYTKAHISVIIPIGNKQCNTVFETPDGKKWLSPGHVAPGLVPVPFLMAQMGLATPLNTTMMFFTKHGMLSGQARQEMTNVALPQTREDGYFLYWDDDTIPDSQFALFTMHEYMQQHPEVGILSGVYATRDNVNAPVVFKLTGGGSDWDISVGPDTGPQEVASVGAGFMLVRAKAVRDAIEKFAPEPIWADMRTVPVDGEPDPVWGQNVSWGHDTRFCTMIREAGYKVMIDGRIECGHWDRETAVMHRLAEDSLPRLRGRKNGAQYWDKIYAKQGGDRIRLYEEMWFNIAQILGPHPRIYEVAAGTGAFGSYITAQYGADWRGSDHSGVAVQMGRARFLEIEQRDLLRLTHEDFGDAEWVVASEVFEHLIPEDRAQFVKLLASSGKNVILTVPDDCYGDHEEHTVQFTRDSIENELLDFQDAGYTLRIVRGDDQHMIVVLRK